MRSIAVPSCDSRTVDDRQSIAQDEAVLDDVIDRLLEVRAGRPGRQVQLSEQEVKQLCLTAKEIFMSQPNLLELEAPIKICGTSALFPLCNRSACLIGLMIMVA